MGSLMTVRRDESARSGFAHIIEQFLEQNFEESESRCRRARQLRGRFSMIASDYDQAVTLVFAGDEVRILDGVQSPVDASIDGPYETLIGMIQGEVSPLVAHLKGQIKVRSSLSRPFFPLHVHNLMKLEPEGAENAPRVPVRWALAIGGAVLVLSATIAYVVW